MVGREKRIDQEITMYKRKGKYFHYLLAVKTIGQTSSSAEREHTSKILSRSEHIMTHDQYQYNQEHV